MKNSHYWGIKNNEKNEVTFVAKIQSTKIEYPWKQIWQMKMIFSGFHIIDLVNFVNILTENTCEMTFGVYFVHFFISYFNRQRIYFVFVRYIWWRKWDNLKLWQRILLFNSTGNIRILYLNNKNQIR